MYVESAGVILQGKKRGGGLKKMMECGSFFFSLFFVEEFLSENRNIEALQKMQSSELEGPCKNLFKIRCFVSQYKLCQLNCTKYFEYTDSKTSKKGIP